MSTTQDMNREKEKSLRQAYEPPRIEAEDDLESEALLQAGLESSRDCINNSGGCAN